MERELFVGMKEGKPVTVRFGVNPIPATDIRWEIRQLELVISDPNSRIFAAPSYNETVFTPTFYQAGKYDVIVHYQCNNGTCVDHYNTTIGKISILDKNCQTIDESFTSMLFCIGYFKASGEGLAGREGEMRWKVNGVEPTKWMKIPYVGYPVTGTFYDCIPFSTKMNYKGCNIIELIWKDKKTGQVVTDKKEFLVNYDENFLIHLIANGAEIEEEQIVYISGEPNLPEMRAIIGSNMQWPQDAKIKWELTVEYMGTIPSGKYTKHREDKIVSISDPMDPEEELNVTELLRLSRGVSGGFAGGKAILSVICCDTCEQYQSIAGANKAAIKTFTFYIRGQNPNIENVKQYIRDNMGYLWYAVAIAADETGGTFWQFNEEGSLGPDFSNYQYCPIWGGPDGWGIFQIDGSGGGGRATISECWDWRANITRGLGIMRKKNDYANRYFSALERTYPQQFQRNSTNSFDYSNPSNQGGGVEGYPVLSKHCYPRVSGLDVLSIQGFNGVAAQTMMLYEEGRLKAFRTCWPFNPNQSMGLRFRFCDNINNYVDKIIMYYCQGNN